MDHFRKIKDWAEDDRPREKLLFKGRQALSDAELLSILIGTGFQGATAVDVAKEILLSCGNNLNQMATFSVKDLSRFKGVGETKAITILTALEIGLRRNAQAALEKPLLNNPKLSFEVIRYEIGDLPYEEFWALHLNQSNKLIKKQKVSQGGFCGAGADQRIIFKDCYVNNTTGIILCHNHPSGNLKPSQADIEFTRDFRKSCELLEFKLLDHLIVNQDSFLSFANEGLL